MHDQNNLTRPYNYNNKLTWPKQPLKDVLNNLMQPTWCKATNDNDRPQTVKGFRCQRVLRKLFLHQAKLYTEVLCSTTSHFFNLAIVLNSGVLYANLVVFMVFFFFYRNMTAIPLKIAILISWFFLVSVCFNNFGFFCRYQYMIYACLLLFELRITCKSCVSSYEERVFTC